MKQSEVDKIIEDLDIEMRQRISHDETLQDKLARCRADIRAIVEEVFTEHPDKVKQLVDNIQGFDPDKIDCELVLDFYTSAQKRPVAPEPPKNDMQPVSPYEVLVEEFLVPLNKLAAVFYVEELGYTDEQRDTWYWNNHPFDYELCARLSIVLGTTAEFWLNLQHEWSVKSANELLQSGQARRLMGRE